MHTIGQRIRTEREALGIDRKELAAAAGVAPTTISELELGRQKSTTALHKIAKKLGVSVEWLETGAGPKHRVQESGGAEYIRQPMFQIMADAVALLQEYLAIRDEPADRVADPALLELAYEVVASHTGPLSRSDMLDLTKKLADARKSAGTAAFAATEKTPE